MADLSPDQWLAWLSQRLDIAARRRRGLRARMDGNAPLPEAGRDLREAYQEFQRKARTNWAGSVVDAVSDRMKISGVLVGDDSSDDDTARAIFKRNRIGIVQGDVHRDMLGLGVGYLSVTGSTGAARIIYERPEQVITEQDPLDPWLTRAGLKVYRDEIAGYDYAVLSLADGSLYRWSRPCIPVASAVYQDSWRMPVTAVGGWTPLDFFTDLAPWCIFTPFPNQGWVGEFERHCDLLDRIDYGVLVRLVIVAIQAYRQRALQTSEPLPERDEAGNVINYGALFRPGPGALWELPPGVTLWESSTTDITPILAAVKDDLRDLSAVTRTPLSTLMPDSVNQTADGSQLAREGLLTKAGDRVERAAASWEQVTSRALAIEAGTVDVPDVTVRFKPVALLSLSERADAATKATNDLPWRSRITDIWGYSDDEADRMEAERSQDALVLGLSQPAAPVPPAAVTSGRPA